MAYFLLIKLYPFRVGIHNIASPQTELSIPWRPSREEVSVVIWREFYSSPHSHASNLPPLSLSLPPPFHFTSLPSFPSPSRPPLQMVRLYRDPKGEQLFTHVTRDATGVSGIATADDNQIHTLQRKVKHLEAQLTNFEVRSKLAIATVKPPMKAPNKSTVVYTLHWKQVCRLCDLHKYVLHVLICGWNECHTPNECDLTGLWK